MPLKNENQQPNKSSRRNRVSRKGVSSDFTVSTGDCPDFRGAMGVALFSEIFAAKMGLSPSGRHAIFADKLGIKTSGTSEAIMKTAPKEAAMP